MNVRQFRNGGYVWVLLDVPLQPERIGRAAEVPTVHDVGYQVAPCRVSWAGEGLDFCVVQRSPTAQVLNQDREPKRIIRSRDDLLIVARVHEQGVAHLTKVVETGSPLPGCFRPAQCRQEHRGENGNDRDDDEKLNQRERSGLTMMLRFRLV